MISFFEFVKRAQAADKPWLVFGQGPTFSDHKKDPDLDEKYLTLGLNRVARARDVFVTHAIDLHVLDDVPDLPERSDWLVMPWTPHVKWRPGRKTLQDLAIEHPVIRRMENRNRLLWYNLCTSQLPPRDGSPVIGVTWFSAEAAIGLLAEAGVRTIRTLGVDGGNKLATEFSFMKPLKAGHQTYSLQDQEIENLVKRYGLDFSKLGPS